MDARFSAVARAWSAADCETMLRFASVSLSDRSRARPARIGRAASSAMALVQLGLQLGRLEAGQNLPLGDPVALAHQHFGEAAGNAALHDRLVDRLGGAGEAHDIDQAARLDDMDLGRNQFQGTIGSFGDGCTVARRNLALAILPREGAASQDNGGADDREGDLGTGLHGRSPSRTKSR